MKTYVMECGCRLKRYDLVRSSKGLLCPEHKAKIANIERPCVDCGQIIVMGTSNSASLRCQKCQRKYVQKLKNESRRRIAQEEEESEGGWVDADALNEETERIAECGYKCIHRLDCIDRAISGNKPLPCVGCDMYECHELA